jgi:hypothetical protein
MNKHIIHFVYASSLLILTSLSFASENETRVKPIITKLEPVEVVLFCPEGSKFEGELVPKWVTTDEATDYFCNDTYEDSEVAE